MAEESEEASLEPFSLTRMAIAYREVLLFLCFQVL